MYSRSSVSQELPQPPTNDALPETMIHDPVAQIGREIPWRREPHQSPGSQPSSPSRHQSPSESLDQDSEPIF